MHAVVENVPKKPTLTLPVPHQSFQNPARLLNAYLEAWKFVRTWYLKTSHTPRDIKKLETIHDRDLKLYAEAHEMRRRKINVQSIAIKLDIKPSMASDWLVGGNIPKSISDVLVMYKNSANLRSLKIGSYDTGYIFGFYSALVSTPTAEIHCYRKDHLLLQKLAARFKNSTGYEPTVSSKPDVNGNYHFSIQRKALSAFLHQATGGGKKIPFEYLATKVSWKGFLEAILDFNTSIQLSARKDHRKKNPHPMVNIETGQMTKAVHKGIHFMLGHFGIYPNSYTPPKTGYRDHWRLVITGKGDIAGVAELGFRDKFKKKQFEEIQKVPPKRVREYSPDEYDFAMDLLWRRKSIVETASITGVGIFVIKNWEKGVIPPRVARRDKWAKLKIAHQP